MIDFRTSLWIIALILIAALISYGLAFNGDPQAMWLWYDVIGLQKPK